MSVQELWVGGVFVVEWTLTDTAGDPATTAVVIGKVSKPTLEVADMVIDHEAGSNVYRASYSPAAGGRYGYKLTATVTALPAGSLAGTFTVSRDTTGADPITVDLTTAVGKVRLLTTDLDEAYPLLTDAQITALIGMEGASIKRGAAACLETIATNETLLTKKITTQDLSIDGPAVAADLRARAKLLREQAQIEVPAGADIDLAYGLDTVDFPRAGMRYDRYTRPASDWSY